MHCWATAATAYKKNDKWAGPYEITTVYPRACAFQLFETMKIFPVFHISLLLLSNPVPGLLGQKLINEAESKNTKERILTRENGEKKGEKTWEFDEILDVHNQNEHYYCIQWKYHAPTWQPAKDLKGQNEAIMAFHRTHPDKCPPLN
jgi:hypothetical protein